MPTDRTALLAVGAGVGAFFLGRMLEGGGSAGTDAAGAAATPQPAVGSGDQQSASIDYPGVLQGVYPPSDQFGNPVTPPDGGGLPGGGPVANPPAPQPGPPVPAPKWWPSWLSAPPASATFAIRFGPGATFDEVTSAGKYVHQWTTAAGFTAYGNSIKSINGGKIGKMLTGGYAGRWLQLRAGTLYLKP